MPLAFLTLSVPMLAQDMIVKADMGQKSWDLMSVSSFRFVDGNMVVKLRNGATTEKINLSEIKTITFGEATTSIISTKSVSDDVKFYLADQHLVVTGLNYPVSVAIYAISGKALFNQSAWTGGSLDISSLPKGIYIVKLGNKNFKFRK